MTSAQKEQLIEVVRLLDQANGKLALAVSTAGDDAGNKFIVKCLTKVASVSVDIEDRLAK